MAAASRDIDIGIIIPARLNSSRIKEKVLQQVNGKSLLERKIEQLLVTFEAQSIYLSTESPVLIEIAQAYDINVRKRDASYSQGHEKTFSQLIEYVVDQIPHSHIWWVPPVVPFFTGKDFENSLVSYLNNVAYGNFESMVSVVEKQEYIWNESGPINYQATKEHIISQELPKWYTVTNGLYAAPRSSILSWKYLIGGEVYLDIKPKRCAIDIDVIEDLHLAKAFAWHYDPK